MSSNQAFLQVRIKEDDCDALRVHWVNDLTRRKVETLRFTRALFGLSTSPFLLGGVIEQHLQNMRAVYPQEVEEIQRACMWTISYWEAKQLWKPST